MSRKILRSAVCILVLIVLLAFGTGMAAPSSAQAAASNRKDIVRVDYIHYARSNPNAAKPKPEGYALMGVKWLTYPVAYAVNTQSIPLNLDQAYVMSAFGTSSEVWDDGTQKELFSDSVSVTAAQYGILDGINAVQFKLYTKNLNVIAITSVWYVRKTKEIVEFDMLYNTYYTWGNADTSIAPVMDLRNIATHELGHSIGLADIYDSSYSYVTMYGYADYEETNKRDLAAEDIRGLLALYPNLVQ